MATIKPKKKTFIIGKPTNLPADAVDVDFNALISDIETLANEFEALGTNGERQEPVAHVISRPSSEKAALESIVVEMTEDVKEQLATKHGQSIFIEEDEPLFPLSINQTDFLMQNLSPNEATESLEIRMVLRGPDGTAVPNARVVLSGMLWVDHAVTNQDGRVTLSLLGETIDTISLLEVKPAAGFWSVRMDRPALVEREDNELTLQPLTDARPGGETVQHQGWGQAAMGLTHPTALTSHVKVAVIDSGLASAHTDLNADGGFDFGQSDQPTTTWSTDGSGHGTHVSGIVGAEDNTHGILGFAPGARLFGLRVFPNASNAKLIAALDWCIDNDVDVINMSLGGARPSPSVQQRLQACREHGILPVAAAGNNGGAVLYPAAFPEAMAVAALGKRGTFPSESGHQKHLDENPPTAGDYFVPSFTCRGPEIDVCAPGVAIVSSVPQNGYAAWDGTSMASPHVAGFATRLLQLNESLRNLPRDLSRSQAMFDAVIEKCTALPGLTSDVQGAGLPGFAPTESDSLSPSTGLARVKELLSTAITLVERETV